MLFRSPKTIAISVVNVLGQKVMELDKQLFNEGENKLHLKTAQLSEGIYFIQLSDGLRAITKPLVIN